MKSHATHAARARNKRGSSVDFARILRGFCVGFARNLIFFLFEREREGYKRFFDCTVQSITFLLYTLKIIILRLIMLLLGYPRQCGLSVCHI